MYKCVVAKYKEDVSWTEDLPCEVTIINKDPNDNRFQINLPNTGRESDTYCHYIIENYENIQPDDRIIFLQGTPWDHMDKEELYSVLPMNGNPTNYSHLPIPLRNRWSYIHHSNIFICYRNGIYNKFNTPPFPDAAWWFCKQFAELVRLPDFDYFISHTGAQWCVPGSYIKNKSKKWWIHARSMHYTDDPDFNIIAGYCFEGMWERIWYHTDQEK